MNCHRERWNWRVIRRTLALVATLVVVNAVADVSFAESNQTEAEPDPAQVAELMVEDMTGEIIVSTPWTIDDEDPDEAEKIEATLLEQGYLHEEIPLNFDLQCQLISVCEDYGVPMRIALGVIEMESSFREDAKNGKCLGLMQINTVNAEWLSRNAGITDLSVPAQNIKAGVYMLGYLYEKYGDWHWALTSYNYGEAGAKANVFDKGHTSSTYSRTVLSYADEWGKVVGE